MMKKEGNWLRWTLSVMLLVVAVQQLAMPMIWGSLKLENLTAELQNTYIEQQTEMLLEQLNPLAEAAKAEPTDKETLQQRLSQALTAQLENAEMPKAQAGSEMKAQIEQQLSEKGLTATDSIAEKLRLLEEEGNRLEQEAMNFAAKEQISGYLSKAQQNKGFLIGIVFLVITGAAVFLSGDTKRFLFSAVGCAMLLSAVLFLLLSVQVQAPVLEISQPNQQQAINTALQHWFDSVKMKSMQIAGVCGVVALVFAAIQTIINKKQPKKENLQ